MKRAVVFTLVTLLITDSFLRGEISAGRSAPNAPCHIVQQADAATAVQKSQRRIHI